MTTATETVVAPGNARLRRLHQRLAAVAAAALLGEDVIAPVPPGDTATAEELATSAGDLLDALVDLARRDRQPRVAWLLLVAVAGHLPTSDQVMDLHRRIDLSPNAVDATTNLLRAGAELWRDRGEIERDLVVLRGEVLIDVDHAARRNRHTGIQRVTREVCTRWDARHSVHLVVWDEGETCLRALAPHEEARVLRWQGPYEETAADHTAAAAMPIVVPWDCVLVLPEVAQGVTARPLAALAELSGTRVVAVGYDAIPVTSADVRPHGEPDMYVRYLNVIKHTRRVAAISTSAAAEFRGFAQAVRAQGLPGPDVMEVPLAAEVPSAPDAAPTDRPEVLVVGSHEIHKNHLAVLHAAELLWREGHDFDLVFVGGPGSASPAFDPELTRLIALGRPARKLGNVTDDELWTRYRSARFTVFPSTHEGFGLPVAEGLACGTPSVTTRYGSTAEIAERGGCLLVDPRDDHELTDAMRIMLTDEDTYQRLRTEAIDAPVRTWSAYAAELWDALVPGLRVEDAAPTVPGIGR